MMKNPQKKELPLGAKAQKTRSISDGDVIWKKFEDISEDMSPNSDFRRLRPAYRQQ
jgi:hypothetical protein